MSTLVDVEDRPSCLPGITSEIHFPKIKTSFSTPSVRASIDGSRYFDSNNNHFNNKNYCHNIHNNQDPLEGRDSSRTSEVNNTLSMAPPARDTSSMLKLPNIDSSKSNQMTCLAGERCRHEHKTSVDNRRDVQANLNKSQHCSSQLDISKKQHNDEEPITRLAENGIPRITLNNGNANSFLASQTDRLTVRFPSILHHQNGRASSLSRASINPSSTSQVNQGLSNPSCSSISRQSMSLIGLKSKLSPRTDAGSTSRSGTGKYALLLPISTSQEYKNREKSKRKRKNNR